MSRTRPGRPRKHPCESSPSTRAAPVQVGTPANPFAVRRCGLRPNRRRSFRVATPFHAPRRYRLSTTSTDRRRHRRRHPTVWPTFAPTALAPHRQDFAPPRFAAGLSCAPTTAAPSDIRLPRRSAPPAEYNARRGEVPGRRSARPVGGHAHGPRRGIVAPLPMPGRSGDQLHHSVGAHANDVHRVARPDQVASNLRQDARCYRFLYPGRPDYRRAREGP